MYAQQYVEQVRKLDECIKAKNEEKRRLILLAEDCSSKMPDGMPHSNTGTVSNKVARAVIDLVTLEEEIDKALTRYNAIFREVTRTLEKLPVKEYGALHRLYISYMTYEQAAEDLGCSVMTVWRREKHGLQLLQKILDGKL